MSLRPGELILWDVRRRKSLLSLEGHPSLIRCVAFRPDGKMLASGSYGRVKLWELSPKK